MSAGNEPTAQGPSADDLQWVQATLQGDQEAFRSIVKKYHGMVFDLSRRMLKVPQEAEDATQEAFLRAYRKLATYQIQYKFSTWLYTVALNVIRNRLRRGWIRKMFSLDEERDDHPIFEPRDPSVLPEQILEGQEAGRLLERMISSLKPEWRIVFVLYYVKDLSCKEIAEITRVSEENVKVRLFRARAYLQKTFKSSLGDVL